MKSILSNIASITQNPHTSVSVLLALGCEIGKIWMPHYVSQWDATQKALFAYGIISSANTPAVPPKQNP